MKQSDLNHLRRLLGWVRCDIGQDPAGQQQTMIHIAGKLDIDSIDADAKARLVEGYRRAEAVPVYVRDAVKALEKALAAAGRSPGAAAPRATAETRADIGFDPGADDGREPVLDDVQIERGLAEIGVYVWGQRGEDWLAGAEYAARILRGSGAGPAATPLQNHPDAAAAAVACRDNPAAPPTLRRDDTGGAGEARPSAPEHGVQGVQSGHKTAGQGEGRRPAITLQVMQEALRLMPSDDARRVAREAKAVSGAVTPEQYVGAGAIAILAKLRAPAADQRGLLPCPFCGSEAFETFKTDDDGIRRHSVHCNDPNCGGQTRDRHFSEAEAIAAWNRRAVPASAPVAARQYHYRMPNCTPGRPECRNGNGYPECPCWHDVGTGPLAGKEATATDWRDKPSAALASAPVAGEARDTYRNMLLEAVHRYGNARAMAEHDIKQRGQISKTVAAILDLLDDAPHASADNVRDAALEACRLVVERFGPTEQDYIFSKRMAIQKCRAVHAAAQAEQGERQWAS